MGLTDEVRAELRESLLQTRAEVEASIAKLTESSKPVSLDQPIGRLSRMDSMQHQQMALAGLNREQQRLEMIRSALDRMDRSDFGDCVSCRKPIALVRLKYFPEATRCIQCAG